MTATRGHTGPSPQAARGARSGERRARTGSASLRRGLAVPFAVSVSVSLALSLPLGGCKRQPAGDPEPPAAEIYIDPATSPPEDADDPASRAPDPALAAADDSGVSVAAHLCGAAIC